MSLPNQMTAFLTIALPFLLSFSSVVAKEERFLPQKGYAGVRIGTLGLQGEIGYMLHPALAFRFQGGGFFHKRETFNFGGVSYHDVEINPQTYNFIADWYFLNDTGFKMSIGGGYNRSRLILNRNMATLNTVTIGSTTVPGTYIGVVQSKYHFRRFTPYVGVGYDSHNIGNTAFSLSLDIGMYFQGDCRAAVSASGPINQSSQGMKVLKDNAQKLIDDTWWIKTYPVVSVSLRYHF